MKKVKLIVSMMCLLLLVMTSIQPAAAYSKSAVAKLPNSNYKVQSNVWQSNHYFFQTHQWAVSAKLYTNEGARATAQRIKTTYSFKATGIGVSASGVSGNTGGGTFSGSWENRNSWISDMSGTFKLGGLPLYSNFSNDAFALRQGIKATASASVFRFY